MMYENIILTRSEEHKDKKKDYFIYHNQLFLCL